MKTLIKTTALLVTLTVLFSVSLNAAVFNFNEEQYIDDIPFDTEKIAADSLYNQAVSVDFQNEEEEYIDDIPFNTECISTNCLFLKAILVDFSFEEEIYINDIEATVFYVSVHLFPNIVDLIVSEVLTSNSYTLK